MLEEGLAQRQLWSIGVCGREEEEVGVGKMEHGGGGGERGGERGGEEEGMGKGVGGGWWERGKELCFNFRNCIEIFKHKNLGHPPIQQVGSQTHEVDSPPPCLAGTFFR